MDTEFYTSINKEIDINIDGEQEIKDNDDYTEEEKREITLEATINAMYECYLKSRELFPVTCPTLQRTDALTEALFNNAEVRSDIDQLINMKIEWE